MSEADKERLAEIRQECSHDWKVVGHERTTSTEILVLSACFLCSSYTYHVMQFVGFQQESLDLRLTGEVG